MKHIFIINPMAGKTDSKAKILEVLKKYEKIAYEFYETKGPRDATAFILITAPRILMKRFVSMLAAATEPSMKSLPAVSDLKMQA